MQQRGKRAREFALTLNEASGEPLFRQIARGISESVQSGRLKAGDTLPSSRSLAKSLFVHRNTVLAAYQALEAEGWLTTQRARGTFVASTIPDELPNPFAPSTGPSSGLGYSLPPQPERYQTTSYAPGTLVLGTGSPDARLIPSEELARAYRRALRIYGATVLNYGDPQGHERLRHALAAMLRSRRGLKVSADDILITRGSQMAIDLVARTLLRPGDVVAVEALGYLPAWEALKLSGARLVPVPVDASGLQVEALERLLEREPIKALYLTPHHQYPSTVTLDAGRRLRLLSLANAHRFAIIEDDYDHEFHYEGRPIMPLASADRGGVVVYVGTLSKILAPGLRLGFVAAPTELIRAVTELRVHVDRQGDLGQEAAIAELIEDGALERHVRRVRRVYQDRRDALIEAMQGTFGEALSFAVPSGGLGLWARCDGVDADSWATRALAQGVAITPGSRYAFDGSRPNALRLGFAALTEAELGEAVRRMARAFP